MESSPCGNDTSTMILSVLDGPEADFTFIPDDSLCVGELINFSGTSTTTITAWNWDFGDGNVAAGQNVSHAYATDGFFDVILTVENDTACVDTVIYTLEIHVLPDADFTIMPDDTVCLNTEMTFDAISTTTILTWDWDFGDGNIASGQTVNHTYAAPGDYNVYLYVLNDNSCTDTVMYGVRIDSLPTCDFTMMPNDTNCINETVFFDGTGSADIVGWDWDFDDGNIANGQNVTHVYASSRNIRCYAGGYQWKWMYRYHHPPASNHWISMLTLPLPQLPAAWAIPSGSMAPAIMSPSPTGNGISAMAIRPSATMYSTSTAHLTLSTSGWWYVPIP